MPPLQHTQLRAHTHQVFVRNSDSWGLFSSRHFRGGWAWFPPRRKSAAFRSAMMSELDSVAEGPYPAIMQSKTLSRLLSTVLNSAAEINLENRAIQALPKWEPWTAFSKKISYLLCLFLLCLPAGWQHLKTKLQILKRGLCLPRICSSKHTLYTNPGPQEAWRRQKEMEKTSKIVPKSVVQQDFPICLTSLLIQRW